MEHLQSFLWDSPFIPHGHCYLWKPGLLWLHLLSDALIALAYYLIMVALLYFVQRRKDVPFRSLFWLFGIFIGACGTTHLLAIWTLWFPTYWLSGTIKALTALISFYTALELIPRIPQALSLPSTTQLEALNRTLKKEIAERKTVEHALRASEAKFRAIFNQTFQLMGLLQPDGTLVAANETALSFGGLTAEEVVGQPFWKTPWWSESEETQQQQLQQSISRAASGEFVRYETHIVGANQNRMTIDFSIKPVRDEAGTVTMLIPEGRDISRLKAAETEVRKLNAELEQRVMRRTAQLEAANQQNEQLLKQEQQARAEIEKTALRLEKTSEKLDLALKAAQMGFWDWDLQHERHTWSPEAETILGYAPGTGEHTYKDWAQRVHPEDLSQVEAEIEVALHEQTDLQTQYRVIWPDGKLRWVEAQARSVFDPDGQPIRMVGTLRDITESVEAEQALRASESRFRAVFEQAAAGMARLSPDGWWIQVNQKLCEMLGYTPEEFLQRNFKDITDPSDHDTDAAYYHQLIAGEIESCSFEKRYLHKNGDPIWVLVTVSKEYDSAGNILCFIAVIEDIRARKQAEQELRKRAEELTQINVILAQTAALVEKRNLELDQFAYVASHDLKAPLRAIANLSQWIEEDLEGQLPDENKHQLQLLRGRVHRMEALINGLLEYSRVGRRDRLVETVDVEHLLTEIVDSLAPPASFEFDISAEIPAFTTNAVALRQVLSNLISNAIKHHDRDDGCITVTGVDRGDRYEFAVSDDGPGIDPQFHDRIFTIFQTLKPRDELESTGIGLSIVKKVIETEGGTIHLESALGEGTTFRFTWPKG